MNIDIDYYNRKFKTTLLLSASQRNDPKILEILIDIGGADVNQVSIPYELTPLMYVSLVADNVNTAKILLDRHADVNKQNSLGQTALHLAVLKYHENVAKLLIKSGANVNLQDIEGQTPLMIAVKNNDSDMVRFLLDNNADFLHKNKDGQSSKDYITKDTDREIKILLQQAQKAFSIHKLKHMRDSINKWPCEDTQKSYQIIWNRIAHFFGFKEHKKLTQDERAIVEYVTNPNLNPDIFYELMLMTGYPLPKKYTKKQIKKIIEN
jgi:ankyrin repeat protein